MSAAECRAYFEHTYRLDGMNAARVLGEAQLEKDAATCAEYGSVNRRHFDCVMAATTLEALPACGVPNR